LNSWEKHSLDITEITQMKKQKYLIRISRIVFSVAYFKSFPLERLLLLINIYREGIKCKKSGAKGLGFRGW